MTLQSQAKFNPLEKGGMGGTSPIIMMEKTNTQSRRGPCRKTGQHRHRERNRKIEAAISAAPRKTSNTCNKRSGYVQLRARETPDKPRPSVLKTIRGAWKPLQPHWDRHCCVPKQSNCAQFVTLRYWGIHQQRQPTQEQQQLFQ